MTKRKRAINVLNTRNDTGLSGETLDRSLRVWSPKARRSAMGR